VFLLLKLLFQCIVLWVIVWFVFVTFCLVMVVLAL